MTQPGDGASTPAPQALQKRAPAATGTPQLGHAVGAATGGGSMS